MYLVCVWMHIHMHTGDLWNLVFSHILPYSALSSDIVPKENSCSVAIMVDISPKPTPLCLPSSLPEWFWLCYIICHIWWHIINLSLEQYHLMSAAMVLRQNSRISGTPACNMGIWWRVSSSIICRLRNKHLYNIQISISSWAFTLYSHNIWSGVGIFLL